MNIEDRIIIDLLNHYAFVLHENVTDLTDKEINNARRFANNYVKKDFEWKKYDEDFKMFVNKQIFNTISDYNYDLVEEYIYKLTLVANEVNNNYDWKYKIYFSVDYPNHLFINRVNIDGTNDEIYFKYNINNHNVEKDIKTNEKSKLEFIEDLEIIGCIYYNCYDLEKLENRI